MATICFSYSQSHLKPIVSWIWIKTKNSYLARTSNKIRPEALPNLQKTSIVPEAEYKSPQHSITHELYNIKASTYHIKESQIPISTSHLIHLSMKEVDDSSTMYSLDSWQTCLSSLESRDNNRRTLPDEINAIHIVDGIDIR